VGPETLPTPTDADDAGETIYAGRNENSVQSNLGVSRQELDYATLIGEPASTVRSCLFGALVACRGMKLQVLVAGIIILLIGGVVEAVGVSEFFSCSSSFFYSTCNFGQPTALLVFGGALVFVGLIVSILGAFVCVAPQLKGLGLPIGSNPIVTERETVVTTEVLIQCRSCGARYPQGTLKCLTCGANL